MSPHLHYEIARARQQEIEARALHAHHHSASGAQSSRRRSRRSPAQLVTAFASGFARAISLTVGEAYADPRR
jgi:hypothetical protein